MINTLKRLFKTGFFHIFGAGSINRIFLALLSIVLVRILSQENFGIYSYAYNIASFFVLFNGLGAASAFLQIGSELHKDKHSSNSIFAYAYRMGICVDVALAIIIIAVGLFAPLAIQGSNSLLLLYCAYPLVTFLVEIKQCYLRVDLKNKDYALMTNIQTGLNVGLAILGAVLFQAIGLVIGQLLANVLSYLLMSVKYPFRNMELLKNITRAEKKDFWKIGAMSSFNNALSQALTLVGTFLVGLLLVDADLVAIYKASTTIPFALLFIPGALIIYLYPYFARHNKDREWTISHYAKLIGFGTLLMGIVTIGFIITTKPIVILVFGEQYLDSVLPMQILLIGFFINAAFRQPTGNLLVTQRKLVVNSIVGAISIAFNVVASLIFIPHYGVVGAAVVYDLTMLLGAVLSMPVYVRVIHTLPSATT